MKILIIGAGLTGCTLAYFLRNKGHDIFIKEKTDHIGGLCFSKKSTNGIIYEPYGAHIFHTVNNDVEDFIQLFGKFNTYSFNKGIIINGSVRHFPISIETIKELHEKEQILNELRNRPKEPNFSNFETYAISIFGTTLYNLFIYNYTKKMWNIEPSEIGVEVASKRLELRKYKIGLFKSSWQGIPIGGYTRLFENMISNIPIEYNCVEINNSDYDLILFSGRIDELMEYKFGILPYRSLKFNYKEYEYWEDEKFGTINLPQHPKYIRKVNFKIIHRQNTKNSWIQYQEAIPASNDNIPMYPINTKENQVIFDKYLKEICNSDKEIPIGRLGLYKYLDMDKAVSLSMDMVPLIEDWKILSPNKRYSNLNLLLEKY